MNRRIFGLFLILALALGPSAMLAQEHGAEKQEEGHEEGGTRQLIWKIVNFVAFFGLLFYFLRKPASDFFAARTAAIQKEMVEAKAAREAAEKRLAEIEQKLARLAEEIAAFRAEAGREDLVTAERMRQQTEAEAAKILASAEAEIDTLARAARLDLKTYTAELAVELAKERLQREMTPETQGRLVKRFVADLGEGKGGSN
jgi:F-type H+-transporting ATPase subunit b